MSADMLINKEPNPIVIKLFTRGRKLNIYLVFMTQSNVAVPKNIRLNLTQSFVTKFPKKRELQKIASNHSLAIYHQDLRNLCKRCNAKPYSFSVFDTTPWTNNSSNL